MDAPAPREVVERIRRCPVGVAVADDERHEAPIVIDGRNGRIILNLPRSAVDAEQLVLHLPDEREDAVQVLLEAHPTDPESDAACDRWLAFHLRPRGSAWASCTVLAARAQGAVVDGDALSLENPLFEAEPAMVRVFNADREALARALESLGEESLIEPLVVGVDPAGVHVRTRTGVRRVALKPTIDDPALALARARQLVDARESGGATP